MILEKGVKIYDHLLKRCVEYVNAGWDMNYTTEDIAGIEIFSRSMFVHFNKEDYTKDAYPITVEIIFRP